MSMHLWELSCIVGDAGDCRTKEPLAVRIDVTAGSGASMELAMQFYGAFGFALCGAPMALVLDGMRVACCSCSCNRCQSLKDVGVVCVCVV